MQAGYVLKLGVVGALAAEIGRKQRGFGIFGFGLGASIGFATLLLYDEVVFKKAPRSEKNPLTDALFKK